MMCIRIIFFLTFLYGVLFSHAANIMSIGTYEAEVNDTITISVEIENDDPFISFQCDIILPVSFQYIVNSALLTERGTDHVLNTTIVSNDRLRLFSYSLNNSKFLGNSEAVVVLQLICGQEAGTYPLELEDCIIGDSLSQNILTSFENGTVLLEPYGLPESFHQNDFKVELYPNPVSDNLFLKLELAKPAKLRIEIFDLLSSHVKSYDLGELGQGKHELDISAVILPEKMQTQNILLCRFIAISAKTFLITKTYKLVVHSP